MEDTAPDPNSWPAKLVVRLGRRMRSNKSYTQEAVKSNGNPNVLKKKPPNNHESDGKINELGERETVLDLASAKKNRDHTDMLHRLAHHDSFDSLVDAQYVKDPYFNSNSKEADALANKMAVVRARQFAALSAHVWRQIAMLLSPADAASLTFTCRTVHEKLGPEFLVPLNAPEMEHEKTTFLHRLDHGMPRHLLCFQCKKFHLRSNHGKESLKADYVANPLFNCPNVRNTVLPRLRLTHGRELPYSFVQLAVRRHSHTIHHGIKHENLARRWKCKDSPWTHQTRYLVHDGRLLMRVVSQAPALPAAEMTETSQRHLLYDREEYTPFFSVCAHWKDGELMPTAKCALSHIPSPPKSYVQQLRQAPKLSRSLARPNFIVNGCDDCRPARRCPECPTEYLIEINMIEDKNDPVRPFKHAIVVTRWSDLGDGSSPHTSPEWAAIKGIDSSSFGASYDSFSQVGRRAVSGIFESRTSGHIPGQRMISMNPKNEKWGDEGHGWY